MIAIHLGGHNIPGLFLSKLRELAEVQQEGAPIIAFSCSFILVDVRGQFFFATLS